MKKFDLKKMIAENKATFFSTLNEGFQGQFYAPEYLEQKYGKEIASKIEAEIDEMDPNSWDRFTGMESAKEVENYISDIKDMMDLSEGTIEEAYNSYTFKVAKNFAKYMSKKEGRDFEVTMNSVDEYSFDLDLDGELYAGGSYLIQNGNIHNVAIPGNPIYATTDDMEDYIGEGYDEFERADKGSKDVTAKDKGEEEVYGAGVKKGEEIEKKKMKMSEFKAKIKEMVLAEMNLDVTDETSGYDFLAEIEEMLDEAEGLTPLQDYIYQYEIEISGEDRAQEFLDDIKKLNTPKDVYDYYAYDRDWSGSMDDDLENIYRQVKRKFKNLNESKGLTPLQDYVYQYEIEVSGKDRAQDYLDDIKQLVTPQDVYDYYSVKRGWEGSDLKNIFKQVKTKFASLNKSDGLTPLQKQAYSYAKERFGFEDAKNSLDQIKTLTSKEEFSDWVQKKIEAEKGLNEEKSRTAKEVFRSIEARDLLNDRREYDVEDLMVAYPGLSEKEAEKLEDMLKNPNLDEAKKDEEIADEEIEVTDEFSTEEPQGPGKIDVTQNANADLTGDKKDVQDNLEAALEAAKALGDEKLATQIGNSLTFFTKQHVVKEDLNESMFPILKRILK